MKTKFVDQFDAEEVRMTKEERAKLRKEFPKAFRGCEPKFEIGDTVRVPAKKLSGTVVFRKWEESCWNYFVGGHFRKESEIVAS